jgi:Animal haem peroxidase
MVGLYAEPKPAGFGFSDTAFRVFVLMAARRLKSDRFFTRDYTANMYTPTGLEWINDSTMGTLLLRHYPELAPALHGIENAFVPWARVG